jgi:glycogen synthase
LNDTVSESARDGRPANGFLCEPGDGADLARALDRALSEYGTPAWNERVRAGLAGDFSWDRSVELYLDIFREAARR